MSSLPACRSLSHAYPVDLYDIRDSLSVRPRLQTCRGYTASKGLLPLAQGLGDSEMACARIGELWLHVELVTHCLTPRRHSEIAHRSLGPIATIFGISERHRQVPVGQTATLHFLGVRL